MRCLGTTLCLLLVGLLALARAQGGVFPLTPGDIQESHPLARGLIHWWLAAPPLLGGTQWWPFVGRLAGTLTNMGAGSGWTGTPRPGWTAAMVFDGTDDAVVMPEPTAFDFADTTFTIALRFRVSNCATSVYLVSKTQASFASGWFLRLTNGILRARIYSNGGESAGRETVTNTALCNNTFSSAVIVFVTSTTVDTTNDVTIYINGLLDHGTRGADGGPYTPHTTAPFTLGQVGIGGTNALPGVLDDVRLWNRGLSATEALAYHRALPPTFDGLVDDADLTEVATTAPAAVKRRVTLH